MNTLAILRSSAEQVALSWEKPKSSTCRGLASGPHDGTWCEVVNKPWKRPPSLSRTHMVTGCRGHSAARRFVAAGVESGMVPSRILQNQSTLKKNISYRKQEKSEKRKDGVATQTQAGKEKCCLDSFPIFVVGFPRETSHASGCRVATRDRFPRIGLLRLKWGHSIPRCHVHTLLIR